MTPANDKKVALSRRELSAAMKSSPAQSQPQKWSRKRGVLTVFSVVAAVGFAAAYITPTVNALANGEPDVVSANTTTSYNEAQAGAQSFAVADEAVSAEVKRDGYEVYVKPKPTPAAEAASEGGGGGGSVPRYTGGGSPSEWMSAAGISSADSGYVNYIVRRESGWNPNATNSSSGACGLVQAYPCSKVPGGGYNPVANLRWANDYAVGRYGSWKNAYNFWTSNHWW